MGRTDQEPADRRPTDRGPADMIGEEEAVGSLRDIARRTDPVPASVLAAAVASLAWRDPDAALARLMADSANRGLISVRTGSGPRLLTFAGPAVTIELQVTRGLRAAELVGQIVPALPARIVVESPIGRRDTGVDAVGRFNITALAVGPVRLRCEPLTEGTFAPVHTEWVLL